MLEGETRIINKLEGRSRKCFFVQAGFFAFGRGVGDCGAGVKLRRKASKKGRFGLCSRTAFWANSKACFCLPLLM